MFGKKRSRIWLFLTSLVLLSIPLAACQSTTVPTEAPTEEMTEEVAPTEEASPTESEPPTPEVIVVTPTPAYVTTVTRDLIGDLEGAVHITDGELPSGYQEAPMLTEKVEAGELPSVEERLPDEPLVVEPLSIGTYGGDYVRAFTGTGDVWGVRRPACNDRFLWWDYTGNRIEPNVAQGYEMLDEGATLRLYLREGLKWSDGAPMTADDILWWYDNIYQNEEIFGAASIAQLQFAGEDIVIEKVDEYTVDYKSVGPNWLFPETLAGFNPVTSPCTWLGTNFGGGIAPAHYLEQFHPDFAGLDSVEQLAEKEGFDTWVQFFQNKASWEFNADLPVLTPWMSVPGHEANQPTWILERNPYYWTVDTVGNQLPYMDRMVNNIAADREVLNLRAIAGEYTFQSRHLGLEKLPLYLESQGQGDYQVYLDPSGYGSNVQLRLNLTVADMVLRELFNELDFRRAVSLGINRDQINEAFFLGLGTPGSPIPDPANVYYPGDEYRMLNHEYDVETANQLLDDLGLTDTDSAGYRLRPDGERLSITIKAVNAFVDNAGIAEMLADQLQDIGIEVIVDVVDREAFDEQAVENEFHAHLWDNGGTDRLFAESYNLFASDDSSTFGPLHGAWYVTNGTEGEEPPEWIKNIMEAWQQGREVSPEERVEIGQQIWRDYVENAYALGIVGLSPATLGVRIARNGVGNVPARQLIGTDFWTPAISHVDTLYWKME